MPVHVGGRKVYLRRGRLTQTVNICDAANRHGQYEKTYVISNASSFVRDDEVASFDSTEGLKAWLDTRGAVARGGSNAPDDAEPMSGSAGARPPSAPIVAIRDSGWDFEARTVVEAAINELLVEFARRPYLHRVEHSMHARLFSLLCDRPLFSQHVALAKGLHSTQPLHKEWPETLVRGDKRRGNFDLAVLSPEDISRASVEQFLEGRIAPRIVIEMGLDYDDGHLLADYAKLQNSRVPCPYVVHLSRDPVYLKCEEEAVQKIHSEGLVRVGYATVVGGQCRVKLLVSGDIVEFGR